VGSFTIEAFVAQFGLINFERAVGHSPFSVDNDSLLGFAHRKSYLAMLAVATPRVKGASLNLLRFGGYGSPGKMRESVKRPESGPLWTNRLRWKTLPENFCPSYSAQSLFTASSPAALAYSTKSPMP